MSSCFQTCENIFVRQLLSAEKNGQFFYDTQTIFLARHCWQIMSANFYRSHVMRVILRLFQICCRFSCFTVCDMCDCYRHCTVNTEEKADSATDSLYSSADWTLAVSRMMLPFFVLFCVPQGTACSKNCNWIWACMEFVGDIFIKCVPNAWWVHSMWKLQGCNALATQNVLT